MRLISVLLVAGMIAYADSHATAQGVAGTWRVTYDSDIRRDGEEITVNKRGKGVLTLEQRGDSVFGSLKGEASPETPRPLSGTFDGKTLKLTTGAVRGRVNINGKATDMPMRTDWMGAVDGTGLRGTMFVQIGDRPAPPRKWEAVR